MTSVNRLVRARRIMEVYASGYASGVHGINGDGTQPYGRHRFRSRYRLLRRLPAIQAAGGPARRAAMMNPIEALRHE